MIFFVGTLGAVFAPSLGVMLPARFILGFAVGGASVTVPVYLSELAPTERRGTLSGRNELAIVVGQMLAFIINAIIFNVWGEHEGVWRIMLAVCAIPAVVLFVGMLRMPESPRWLISKGRHDDALGVLMQVRTEDRARAEMAEWSTWPRRRPRPTWAAGPTSHPVGPPDPDRRHRPGDRSAVHRHQLGHVLRKPAAGGGRLPRSAALIANIAPGVIAVIGSAICLFYLIDRVPRRKLIIGALIATTTCHGLIVLASKLLPDGTAKAYVILALVVAFVFCMQLALNVPVWVCLSELFPLRMRGFGMGLCVLVLWVTNAIIAFCFPILVVTIGITGSFLVFFALGLIFIAFLWKMLPNTSGRSLEQLEEAFAAGDFR